MGLQGFITLAIRGIIAMLGIKNTLYMTRLAVDNCILFGRVISKYSHTIDQTQVGFVMLGLEIVFNPENIAP